MIKVGVVGVTGYTGFELVASILRHPELELHYAAADSTAGRKFSDVYPQFVGKVDIQIKKYELSEVRDLQLDVMFLALPHGFSMAIVGGLLDAGIKVVDLGADYRLKDIAQFEQWYPVKHTDVEPLEKAVYGMPEKYRDQIRSAELVANPGCYPTSVILGIWPLLVAGITPLKVIADSKSGVSGAGKKLADPTHYCHANESISAYKVLRHQHTPEISQEIQMPVTFVTHLLPMTRGILSTMYVTLTEDVTTADLRKIYEDVYADEPFTTIAPPLVDLGTKMVYGTNNCLIQVYGDGKEIVVVSVIDNLIKGAAGQAMQNLNIMMGLREDLGLNSVGLFP